MSEDDAPKRHTATKEAGSPQNDGKDKELHAVVKHSDHVAEDSEHAANGQECPRRFP